MQNNIINFDFNNNQVRTQLLNNEPYFCLKDICNILEIKQSKDTIRRLDEKGAIFSSTLTNGGIQNIYFINEPNLYRVIFRSNNPEAKHFQDWVFNEVLPTLRKTGTYTTNKQDYKLYNLSFPLNIFSRTSLRYKIIDNIPYFIDNDIFSIIGLDNNYKPNNINETLSKLNITRLLISPNEMIFGLNISQIFEILAYVKNERCKLLKKFLVSSDVIEKLFIETNLIN